jgi:cell wall-associated NlpC family hydrolase
MENLNLQIAERAELFVKSKVPYQHRGMSFFGCDCTGLLVAILRQLGFLQDFTMPNYDRDWNLHIDNADLPLMTNFFGKTADSIPKNEKTTGDILVFGFGRCQRAHTGVYLRDNLFAHCFVTAGRCVYGTLQNSQWGKRWTNTYRMNSNKLRAYVQ